MSTPGKAIRLGLWPSRDVIKALGVLLTRVQERSDDPQATVLTVIAAGNAIYDGPRRRRRHINR
jgi:hypothetical protein